MKRWIACLLALLLCLPLCACREEKELEPWAMPQVDTKPTPMPTAPPSFGGGNVRILPFGSIIWPGFFT